MEKLRNSAGRSSSEDFRTKKLTQTRRRLVSYDGDETGNEKISNGLTSDIPSTSKFTDFVAPPPKNCVKNNFQKLKLTKWCFRISPNQFSVTVEGFTPKNVETGKYSRSSKIVERFSPTFLKSYSGSVYILSGPLDVSMAKIYRYPDLLIKKFRQGFPPDWEKILQKYYEKANAHGEFKTNLLDQILIDTASTLSEDPPSVLWSSLKLNFLDTFPSNSETSSEINENRIDDSSKNLVETKNFDPRSFAVVDLTIPRNLRKGSSIVESENLPEMNLIEREMETFDAICEQIPVQKQFFSRRLSSKLKECRAKTMPMPSTKQTVKKKSQNLIDKKQKIEIPTIKSKNSREPASCFDFVSEAEKDRPSPTIFDKQQISTEMNKKWGKTDSKRSKNRKFSTPSPELQTYKVLKTRFGRIVKPRLAEWNGQRICYDIYGNPLTYENCTFPTDGDNFRDSDFDFFVGKKKKLVEKVSRVRNETKKIKKLSPKNVKSVENHNDRRKRKPWSDEEINILKNAVKNKWPTKKEWKKFSETSGLNRTAGASEAFAKKHLKSLKLNVESSSKKSENNLDSNKSKPKPKPSKRDENENLMKIRKRKMPTLKEKKQQKKALKLASVGDDDDADFFRQANFLGLPLKILDIQKDNLSTATTPRSVANSSRFGLNDSRFNTPMTTTTTPCSSSSALRSMATQYVHRVQKTRPMKITLPPRRRTLLGKKLDVEKVASMLKNVENKRKFNRIENFDDSERSSVADEYFQFNSS